MAIDFPRPSSPARRPRTATAVSRQLPSSRGALSSRARRCIRIAVCVWSKARGTMSCGSPALRSSTVVATPPWWIAARAREATPDSGVNVAPKTRRSSGSSMGARSRAGQHQRPMAETGHCLDGVAVEVLGVERRAGPERHEHRRVPGGHELFESVRLGERVHAIPRDEPRERHVRWPVGGRVDDRRRGHHEIRAGLYGREEAIGNGSQPDAGKTKCRGSSR